MLDNFVKLITVVKQSFSKREYCNVYKLFQGHPPCRSCKNELGDKSNSAGRIGRNQNRCGDY